MDEPPPFGLPLPCLGYGGCSAEVIIDYCKIAPCFKVIALSVLAAASWHGHLHSPGLRQQHLTAYHSQQLHSNSQL